MMKQRKLEEPINERDAYTKKCGRQEDVKKEKSSSEQTRHIPINKY
jgi:hypothetical protein